MELQLESAGRKLAVQFTCSRCRKTVVLLFKDVMKSDHYGYLHNSELPKGWKETTALGNLFCEECMEAYIAFLAAGRDEKQNG